MTDLVFAIASLLALTSVAWLAGTLSKLPVCPICVGVSGTWLWMLAARLLGFGVDSALLGMFLGASVVGGAYWIDKRLPQRSSMLWKTLALPAGFAAAYGLVAEQWLLAVAAATALAVLTAFFLRPRHGVAGDPAVVAQLEQRMKKCC